MRKLTVLLPGMTVLFGRQSWARSPATEQAKDANHPIQGATINLKKAKGATTGGIDRAFKITALINAPFVVCCAVIVPA